jgi:peptidoglycan/LPS O-acetylase OafA/YrhL
MNERFENINLLRAYAAVSVVIYHVISYMKWEAFPTSGPLLAFRIGWIGVDLFFVISGFVITRSALAMWRRDPVAFPRQYAAHRLSRIVPLYLLTCALWIALFQPDFFDEPLRALWQIAAHVTFTHTFSSFTYAAIDGVNWTLGIEMQFYLLVALLISWIARTPGWRIWLVCILIALSWRAVMVFFFIDRGPTRLFMTLMQLPGTLDEFGAGIFLALWFDRRSEPRRIAGWLWALGAIVTGTICMSIYWSHSEYWDDPRMIIFWRSLLGVFFVCVVAAAVYLPSVARSWPLRPVWYLGEVSYGIYLWHMFAVQLCLGIPDLTPLQALGITLGLTVLLAAASWHFFEKPILEWGRRFRGSGRPRRQPAAAGGS